MESSETAESLGLETPIPNVPSENFYVEDDNLVRSVKVGDTRFEASIPMLEPVPSDRKGAWWKAYLSGTEPSSRQSLGEQITTVDLFCGAGGLALGLQQLCSEIGAGMVAEAIFDQDEEATRVYASNHRTRRRSSVSVSSLVDYTVRGRGNGASYLYEPEMLNEELAALSGHVDVVLAGPPCQGHSNLNNSSRRDDRRNELYLTVPAIAIALEVPAVIIENVPSVVHDTSRVVETSRRLLKTAGYGVTSEVLSAADMGWPQSRDRYFMVARKDEDPLDLEAVSTGLRDRGSRSVWWAIADLADWVSDSDPMTRPTELSTQNQRRIDWLFDNEENELALSERPESHRGGTTYTSVYGRMKKDAPAPTITTGFMTPGRGRYVHPTRKRVLTAREAARLQGFPDTYRFVTQTKQEPTRKKLSKWIGDAVPMPLGYAAAISALGPSISADSIFEN